MSEGLIKSQPIVELSIERKITVGSSLWHRLPAFLYPTSHFVELPCQLVWQEAKIRKLDNSDHTPHTPDFHSCSSPQAATNTSENRDFGQSKASSLRILFTHETSSNAARLSRFGASHGFSPGKCRKSKPWLNLAAFQTSWQGSSTK